MKTKDLRLGNYVTDSSGFTMYVVGIYEDTVLLNFEGNEGDILEVKEKDLNPVLLTEDLLLKCGFEITHDRYYNPERKCYELDDLFITPIAIPETIRKNKSEMPTPDVKKHRFHVDAKNSSINSIINLHQLQNLYFALKGKELEINL